MKILGKFIASKCLKHLQKPFGKDQKLINHLWIAIWKRIFLWTSRLEYVLPYKLLTLFFIRKQKTKFECNESGRRQPTFLLLKERFHKSCQPTMVKFKNHIVWFCRCFSHIPIMWIPILLAQNSIKFECTTSRQLIQNVCTNISMKLRLKFFNYW